MLLKVSLLFVIRFSINISKSLLLLTLYCAVCESDPVIVTMWFVDLLLFNMRTSFLIISILFFEGKIDSEL